MNNYANMGYYMPEKILGMNDIYDNISMINNQIDNVKYDQKLASKLNAQAGNNMNFNKCNYMPNASPNNMYDAYEGFIRGNMFPDLYNAYKISKPYDIRPMNEQAEILTYIDAYCFAAHDLNLYLDTHPNDQEMISLFKQYTDQANNLIKQYEQKYGPLFVGSGTSPWTWNNSPWPWENK